MFLVNTHAQAELMLYGMEQAAKGIGLDCSCATTYIPSHKSSKLDELDMLDIAGEVRMKS